MKSAPFDYIQPKNLTEASRALDRDSSAVAIAGGQSLLPMLNLRVVLPELVVDIARLPELAETKQTPDDLLIGASTTHADIEDGKLPSSFNGLLQKVASRISYRTVRHYGTIGGSLALADPSADWPVCLTALDASVLIEGKSGRRSELVSDFIRRQYTTSLAKDELVTGVRVPLTEKDVRWGTFKVVRKSGAFATSIVVIVERKDQKKVTVVLGAATERPLSLKKTAEQLLSSKPPPEEVLRQAITTDLSGHLPTDDKYLWRLHTSTILHAVREMSQQ